jgi:hypothetical protein
LPLILSRLAQRILQGLQFALTVASNHIVHTALKYGDVQAGFGACPERWRNRLNLARPARPHRPRISQFRGIVAVACRGCPARILAAFVDILANTASARRSGPTFENVV